MISGDYHPEKSQTLMLVWNWERLHIETIDPNETFFFWTLNFLLSCW